MLLFLISVGFDLSLYATLLDLFASPEAAFIVIFYFYKLKINKNIQILRMMKDLITVFEDTEYSTDR